MSPTCPIQIASALPPPAEWPDCCLEPSPLGLAPLVLMLACLAMVWFKNRRSRN